MFSNQNQVEILRSPVVEGLELFRGKKTLVTKHNHFHREFQIAIVEDGAIDFQNQSVSALLQRGDLLVCNPEEVHTAESSHEQGWTFRMLYADPQLLIKTMGDITEGAGILPTFKPFHKAGKSLENSFRGLCRSLRESESKLEIETRLLNALGQLITDYACAAPPLKTVGREHWAVKRVCDYLQDNFAENVSLDELSNVACLSKFHLVRVFKTQTGLPPHAFQTQIRVSRARKLLASGKPLSFVAHTVGFAHESHLTRHFNRIVSFTPGHYQQNSNIVQHKAVL